MPRPSPSLITRVIACLLLGHLSLAVYANPTVDAKLQAQIKASVERHTKGQVSIDELEPTPIPGIFQAVSGQDVFYVDRTGRYGFVNGRLVDMAAMRDLTEPRINDLSRVDFQKLPLALALKEVHGTGRRQLAVFEDPACSACRSLAKFMSQLPDVTLYRFMYTITDPRSMNKAKAAWCASDRLGAWTQLMNGGADPVSAPCDTQSLDRVLALGDELQIQGTPTVFLPNGRRLVGATPPEEFKLLLDQSATP